MESERKRRVWRAGWIALGIAGLGVAYPLSVGPVGWWVNSTDVPEWLGVWYDALYTPLFVALEFAPDSVGQLFFKYRSWWY